MSKAFNTIKRYYDKGWYTKEDVARFVVANDITAEEYELIVGEPYIR